MLYQNCITIFVKYSSLCEWRIFLSFLLGEGYKYDSRDSNAYNEYYHSQNKTKGNRVVPHFVSQLDNNKTQDITSYRKMEGKMSNLYWKGNSNHSNHWLALQLIYFGQYHMTDRILPSIINIYRNNMPGRPWALQWMGNYWWM